MNHRSLFRWLNITLPFAQSSKMCSDTNTEYRSMTVKIVNAYPFSIED